MKKLKEILRPICWIKTLWRTLERIIHMGYTDGISVDGCDYVEQENGDLICEICGKKETIK